jgi:hypothetical protein
MPNANANTNNCRAGSLYASVSEGLGLGGIGYRRFPLSISIADSFSPFSFSFFTRA